MDEAGTRRRWHAPPLIKQPGQGFTNVRSETVVAHGAVLVVAGHADEVRRFRAAT